MHHQPSSSPTTCQRQLANQGLDRWPADQFACVWKAFGDSSVLYHLPEEREARRVPEATLGELYDEAAESYKTLSDEQQKLSVQDWRGGPRLVRGVAGSGKTIVLANNLARRLGKGLGNGETLFELAERPRLLAVCYNRTLAPLIRQKIDLAFRQRTGRTLPEDAVEVWHYNRLLWHLSTKGLWRYQAVESKDDQGRAGQYLDELEHVRQHQPGLIESVAYDALYVDEGQDFLEEDFRLLKGLCRTPPDGEPDMHIFYDDAQNLLGRKRPNWRSLGLNLVGGRSHVMSQCFRNTRPLIEASFNVLFGRFAESREGVPTDIATMEEKGLIEDKGDRYEVRFAVRDGMPPRLSIATNLGEERCLLVDRLRWLIEDQKVRPEDILVLAHSWNRVRGLAEAVRSAGIPTISEVHVAKEDQDRILKRRGCLTFSTVASAKGYDAYCVLLASANDFPTDVNGRASFYVGCTRAIEYLEVFAHQRSGLVAEMEKALTGPTGSTGDAVPSP
jgi:superfamily I DNA and RNA helicase